MPRCSCRRNIAAGADAQKMICEYIQPDATTKIFGFGMSDGPLSAATGRLVRAWHYRCYWVAKKRDARGNAVTGRVVAGTPTAYEIADMILTADDVRALGLTPEQVRQRSTVQLSARLNQLRAVAARLGKGVGDPTVQEALLADQHGGPYPHQHQHRLDTYQLLAHLQHAHGLSGVVEDAQAAHVRVHARQARDAIEATRTADNDNDPPVRDWRTQHTADL